MKRQIARLGFYASVTAFLAAAGYGVVQLLQLTGAVVYPLDDILIYSFSLAIAPPFLIAMLALHYLMPNEQKFWSHAALLFAVMYNVYVLLMYTVQLASVIPLSLKNPTETILTVRPHSFFWTIDALGYICMSLSTLFAAFLFKKDSPQRWLRRFLMANGMVIPFISFAYFYPHFSTRVLLVGAPWIITAPGSIFLLAIFFRKATII